MRTKNLLLLTLVACWATPGVSFAQSPNATKAKTTEGLDLEPLELQTEVITSKAPNDCAIVTFGTIAGIPHSQAKATLFQYGWSSNSGFLWGMMEVALKEELGYECFLRKDLSHRKMNVKTLNGLNLRGTFVVCVSGHIMPLTRGKVWNVVRWDAPVVEVFEVVEIEC